MIKLRNLNLGDKVEVVLRFVRHFRVKFNENSVVACLSYYMCFVDYMKHSTDEFLLLHCVNSMSFKCDINVSFREIGL